MGRERVAKDDFLARVRAVFDRWEQFLASKSDREWVAPRLPGGWSVRDVVLHLMAWQQISISRLQAALEGTEPMLPGWMDDTDPFDAEEHTADCNARILDLYRAESWSSVHRTWRTGFLNFVELAEAIPEEEMNDAGRYPWLKGYPLLDVVIGSWEHHEEHLEELLNDDQVSAETLF